MAVDESLDYNNLKDVVLQKYDFNPEVYRQSPKELCIGLRSYMGSGFSLRMKWLLVE